MGKPGPIPDSYWLIDGMLLAGEYPATYLEDATREKLAKFLDAGIRTFIDLTEQHEPLAKYDRLLRELSDDRKIETRHIRSSVRDGCIPHERGHMERILGTIREEMDAGRPVYVHCWGGIGRTGNGDRVLAGGAGARRRRGDRTNRRAAKAHAGRACAVTRERGAAAIYL